jgi:hypothetical protein
MNFQQQGKRVTIPFGYSLSEGEGIFIEPKRRYHPCATH